MNTTHRRHPRTLQEAFGPYTNHFICDPIAPLRAVPTRPNLWQRFLRLFGAAS